MLIFLMILCSSVPVLVLSAFLFSDMSRRASGSEQAAAEGAEAEKAARQPAASPARFFAPQPAFRQRFESGYPIDALLSQIESHVRLEQAAAESFLDIPTAESLHSRTTSPLLN